MWFLFAGSSEHGVRMKDASHARPTQCDTITPQSSITPASAQDRESLPSRTVGGNSSQARPKQCVSVSAGQTSVAPVSAQDHQSTGEYHDGQLEETVSLLQHAVAEGRIAEDNASNQNSLVSERISQFDNTAGYQTPMSGWTLSIHSLRSTE